LGIYKASNFLYELDTNSIKKLVGYG